MSGETYPAANGATTPSRPAASVRFLDAVKSIAPKTFGDAKELSDFATGIANFAVMNNQVTDLADGDLLATVLDSIANERAPTLSSNFVKLSKALVYGSIGAVEHGGHLPYRDLLGAQRVEQLRTAVAGLRPGTDPKYAALWAYNEVSEVWSFDSDRATNMLLEEIPFATFRDTEMLYRYDAGVYREDGSQTAKAWIEARHVERGQKATIRGVAEVVEAIRRRTYTLRSEFQPKGKICVSNGILNLDARNLEPHSPGSRFLVKFPVDFDSTAACPKFERFIREILHDEADRTLVQDYFGSTLRLGNPHKYALLLVGPTDSGRSTLSGVLRDVIGRDGISALPLQSLVDNRFAAAELFGKFANVCPDLPAEAISNPSYFKGLTGNDLITAERKFSHPFAFVNLAKLIFSANEIPRADAADPAFFRRWLIVLFDTSIPEDRQVTDLCEQLVREEGSGILNWMLTGLHRLEARGRFAHKLTLEDTTKIWRERSNPVAWFIDAKLVRDYSARIEKEGLFAAYVAFCKEKRVPALHRDRFFTVFKSLTGAEEQRPRVGSVEGRDVRLRLYAGFRLGDDTAPDSPALGRQEEIDRDFW